LVRIDENSKAEAISLNAEQLRRIDTLPRPGLAECRPLV
jgi:hypothetical protein